MMHNTAFSGYEIAREWMKKQTIVKLSDWKYQSLGADSTCFLGINKIKSASDNIKKWVNNSSMLRHSQRTVSLEIKVNIQIFLRSLLYPHDYCRVF